MRDHDPVSKWIAAGVTIGVCVLAAPAGFAAADEGESAQETIQKLQDQGYNVTIDIAQIDYYAEQGHKVTLLTPDSRFDRWLRGDANTLSSLELSGYRSVVDRIADAKHDPAEHVGIDARREDRFGIQRAAQLGGNLVG